MITPALTAFPLRKLNFVSIRTLRRFRPDLPGKSTVATKKEFSVIKRGSIERSPRPAHFLKIPEKPSPVGIPVVDTWKSPLQNEDLEIKSRRDRYEERFLIADEINSSLEQASGEYNKILNVVAERSKEFDNMNAFNALGYLHTHVGTVEINSLISDTRFITLCNLLYKKCRSYPPNACIANISRLLDFKIPFTTPIIYIHLELLKHLINDFTVNDALSLAQTIYQFDSLQLPVALKAGMTAFLEKTAEENFERMAGTLQSENSLYNIPNSLIFFRHFGNVVHEKVRKKILRRIIGPMIGEASLSRNHLIELLSLLEKKWVPKDIVDLAFTLIEQYCAKKMDLHEALNVTQLCFQFKRWNEPIVLKKVVDSAISTNITDENASRICELLFYLSKVNYMAPELFNKIEPKLNTFMTIFEVSDFLETFLMHFDGDSTAISKALEVFITAKVDILNPRDRLILHYLKMKYGLGSSNDANLPFSVSEIEDMLVGVTNEAFFDIHEKLKQLPRLLKDFKELGADCLGTDLVFRLYIPAIFRGQKMYVVPVSSADLYQNRFDVVWRCRLRFMLLHQFLEGSQKTVSIVPINMVRFGNFTSSSKQERVEYIKNCLENGGDCHLLEMLHILPNVV